VEWRRADPAVDREYEHAHRLLVLLAMICDLPSGEIADYSYQDWARVMGITEGEVLAAADLLAAWDISYRDGGLARPATRCRVVLPPAVFDHAALSLELG